MYPVQGRRGAVCRFPALALAVLAAVAGLWPAQPARAATVQPAGAATALPVAPAVARRTRQLITVTAASYSSTYATFRAYRRSGNQWVRVLGPWTARVGYHGIAPAGRKREGDGRTPSGTYGFSFFFGVLANPGVTFRWRHAYGYDVWDDDPASPRYNEWVDEQAAGRRAAGIDPEPMHDQPRLFARPLHGRSGEADLILGQEVLVTRKIVGPHDAFDRAGEVFQLAPAIPAIAVARLLGIHQSDLGEHPAY